MLVSVFAVVVFSVNYKHARIKNGRIITSNLSDDQRMNL